MRKRCAAAALLVSVLPAAALAAAAAGAAAPPAVPRCPDAATAARLAGGEVLLSSHPVGPRSFTEEMGRGVIDAPPSRVFAALTDFAHYREWVPFVKRSEARRAADGSIESFQSLGLPFPLGNRHYWIHAWSEAPAPGGAPGAGSCTPGTEGTEVWRVWWTYVPHSGNVADHYGWWALQPFGAGRTLGTCLLYTDPGNAPAWALHLGTSETVPYIFSGLRQQVRRSRYDLP